MLVYANYGAIKTRNVSTSLGGRRACFKTSAFITKNVPNWISNASIVTQGPDPPDVRGAETTVLIGINKLKSSHKFSFSSRKSQRKKIRKILFYLKEIFRISPKKNPRYIQQSIFIDMKKSSIFFIRLICYFEKKYARTCSDTIYFNYT